MSGDTSQEPEAQSAPRELILEFANFAATFGWSAGSLREFCSEHGIDVKTAAKWWPRGVRSVAQNFNAIADQAMIEWVERTNPKRLSDILSHRFEANQQFKPTVRQLAKSDTFHPFDTFSRTADTAERMLCSSRGIVPPRSQVALLVILYSGLVLIWLSTERADRALGRAIRLAALIAGEK